jgi:hypothetical protein
MEPTKVDLGSGIIFRELRLLPGVSRELPEVLLSRLDVIAVIGVTLVNSVASELSKSEADEISAMDKVTPSERH